jgi:membrane protease YdiL (CAAX protease family)
MQAGFCGLVLQLSVKHKGYKVLPTRNENFQHYFEPAIKTKAPWRLVVGIVIILTIYFGFFGVFGAVFVWVAGMDVGPAMLEKVVQGADPLSVILLLTTFAGLFLGVLAAVRIMHKRGLKSLIGPSWRQAAHNFWIAALCVAILSSVGFLIATLFYPSIQPIRQMELFTWVSWMILGIPLLLVQVSSEELIFRGYFQQQLAARFHSRWVWYVLPSVLFGLMHYDPGTMGSNAWIVVAHTTLFGLIAADVTARTGNLGTAIGFHFANNLFALTIVGLDGSLSGLALYKSAIHVSDEAAIRSALVPDFIFLVFLYGLFMLWARNRPQW